MYQKTAMVIAVAALAFSGCGERTEPQHPAVDDTLRMERVDPSGEGGVQGLPEQRRGDDPRNPARYHGQERPSDRAAPPHPDLTQPDTIGPGGPPAAPPD